MEEITGSLITDGVLMGERDFSPFSDVSVLLGCDLKSASFIDYIRGLTSLGN